MTLPGKPEFAFDIQVLQEGELKFSWMGVFQIALEMTRKQGNKILGQQLHRQIFQRVEPVIEIDAHASVFKDGRKCPFVGKRRIAWSGEGHRTLKFGNRDGWMSVFLPVSSPDRNDRVVKKGDPIYVESRHQVRIEGSCAYCDC